MDSFGDDDDDFDVIQENSPLYWSMIDAGLENVGDQDVCRQNVEKPSMTTGLNVVLQDYKKSWKQYILELIAQLTMLFSTNCPHGELRRYVEGKALRVLAGSALLTHEDALFLQDAAADSHHPDYTPPALLTRKMMVLLVTSFSCLLLSVLSSWLPFSLWMTVVINTACVLALPFLVKEMTSAWRTRNAGRNADQFQDKVDNFLSLSARSMDLSTKCVRFIQESELVARGFTFVGNTAGSRVLNETQRKTKERLCPKLREKLFLSSKALFILLRQSFTNIVKVCPVSVEVGGVVRYCSEVPLAQYPEMLQPAHTHQDAATTLHDLTDAFSLDVLKSMLELNRIHISELVRRLAVCFVQDGDEHDAPSRLAPVVQRMGEELETLQTDLQSHLTAHRQASQRAAQRNPQRTTSSPWQAPSSGGQLRLAHTAVHSLELHLLAALNKIQDISQNMEEQLETRNVDSAKAGDQGPGEDEIDEPCRESWNQMLMLVQSEMKACSGCLEEGVARLRRKNVTESLPSASERKEAVPKKNVETKLVTISAEDNPIIMDEVFEAYSEPPEYGQQGSSQDMSAEEEAWHKKQKRDLKLCLNELQSIIDVRAAQTQERERIAVDRMKSHSASHILQQGQDPQSDNGGFLRIDSDTELNQTGEMGAKGSREIRDEDADDLAKDIEERVEFWKQFDQRELVGTLVQEEDSSRQLVDEDSGLSRAETSGRVSRQVSASGSLESGFVFVADQASRTASAASSSSLLGEEAAMLADERSPSSNDKLEASPGEREDANIDTLPRNSLARQQTEVSDNCLGVVSDGSCNAEQRDSIVAGLKESYFKDSRDGSLEESPVIPEQTVLSGLEETSARQRQSNVSLLKESIDLEQSNMSLLRESSDIIEQTSTGPLGESSDLPEQSSVDLLGESTDLPGQSSVDLSGESTDLPGQSNVMLAEGSSDQVNPVSTGQSELPAGSDTEWDQPDRPEPEGTAEHLSLPAAPSPFAFSIASMVASRAKNLTRAVDTFGDSSSSEGEEEET